MKKKEIKAEVEKGKIHCRIMLQVAGTPKQHVEDSLKGYISTIDSDEAFTIIESDINPAEKEEEFYSSFADIELLARDANALSSLCFNYMPSNIEIIDPKQITYKKKEIDEWFNDLLAKLHEISMLSKEVSAQNRAVIQNTRTIIQNAIMMAVSYGKTLEEMAESLGMKQKDLEPFVKSLIKAGKLKAKKKGFEKISEKAKKKAGTGKKK